MKAAFIRSHGGGDRVEVGEFDDPRPAAGEALLEVRSAALNHLDIWVREGGRAEIPMPHVLGSDAAGVVVAVGEGVAAVREGDEVLLNPALSCGGCEFCRRGEQSLCADFGLVGMARPGTFAEFVAVPARNLHPKPDHLDWASAAALPLTWVTAWRMLVTRAKLTAGETVLIHGIGGGVALAGLQIARLFGARAIVTSSFDEKLTRAAALGAAGTINYTQDDVADAVADMTDGRGVDVAFDAVGAATWPIDIRAVRRAGRVVLCGVTTGASAETDLQAVYWNQLSLLGSTMGGDEDFRRMLGAVRDNACEPVIDSQHPLEDVRAAQARMEDGEQFGKIVLNISE